MDRKKSYWQQHINYDLTVTLNDKDHTLDGHIKMEYFNRSSDSLYFIWIHLWPNAYKNDKTAYTDQALLNGSTAFYFSNEEERGYINSLNFKVNEIPAETEDDPMHQDIIKVLLPSALPPGKSINITSPFHVKLPHPFSRSGHIQNTYHITQWYPKPAVYDKNGWHKMPYLDQGEFYSEFGDFTVTVNVPENYVIATTGSMKYEEINDGIKSIRYEQKNVHDFAWFADKDFIVLTDSLQLINRIINVKSYYYKTSEEIWKNSIQHIKNAIKSKSEWIGVYPYDDLAIVENKMKNKGGMEYPAISLISTPDNVKQLDLLINHETGHNWFQGILASNERAFPWMDEGMNTYYDNRYLQMYYPDERNAVNRQKFFSSRLPDNEEQLALNSITAIKKDQPIATSSENFSSYNYNAIAYTKAAAWLKQIESYTGTVVFDSIMKTYYQEWKFAHPYPEDFKQICESVSGKSMDSLFSLIYTKGSLETVQDKKIKIKSFISLKDTDKYNYLFILPVIGYNNYDKLMAGIVLHNYTLPRSSLRFIIAPLYATGSKQLNGTGKISYTLFPGNSGQALEFSLAGSRFTGDIFTDSLNNKNFLFFSKLVPSLKYTFKKREPKNSITNYIQWKSYLINEKSYLFTNDTIQQKYIITYPVNNRMVHQFRFVTENTRTLYPYRLQVMGETGNGFLKTTLNAEYYFNYKDGGGLSMRFFAGKFFYTSANSLNKFNTYRYHLNMTGANGYEDYTYSNYFIGRNEFEGLMSQQIMIKEGGFKVRTDLLSNKYGRTDNWLSAVNLTTDIPKNIIPVPIKIFADIGTYAEAWDKDAPTGKFVYDAGIQLSLFKNVFNIYIPVLYSKVYRDYYKSYVTDKKFRKSISFSIDIQNLRSTKLFPQLPL